MGEIKSLFISSKIIKNYGIIKISSFMPDFIYDEFINHMKNISKSDVLIIDLRMNKGGLIETAIKIVSHLLEQPVMLYYEQKRECMSIENYNLTEPKEVWVMPNKNVFNFSKVFILQDEFTGSCCENIIINALTKSNENVITVGDNTAGFHNESTITPVIDGSNLQITNKLLTKDGYEFFNYKGMKPDILFITDYFKIKNNKAENDYVDIINVIESASN